MKDRNPDLLFGILMFFFVAFPVLGGLGILAAAIVTDIFSDVPLEEVPLPVRIPLILGCIAFFVWRFDKLK